MRRLNIFWGVKNTKSRQFIYSCWMNVFFKAIGKVIYQTWRIYFSLVSIFKSLKSIVQILNKANLGDLIAAISLVNSVQLNSNNWFFGPYDLEIRWMNLKTIEHLCWAASSSVHHFTTISEQKLVLQSGGAKIWSNSAFVGTMWHWKLTGDIKSIGHIFYLTSSFVHLFVAIDDFKL